MASSYRSYVIQHTKTETGQWLLTEYRGQNASLSLQGIPFELGLMELYEGVDFGRTIPWSRITR